MYKLQLKIYYNLNLINIKFKMILGHKINTFAKN